MTAFKSYKTCQISCDFFYE